MKIIDYIGNTPLLHLSTISEEVEADIYVKAEMFNPGGSVKDRAALAYIKGAMSRGELAKGDTVVEASSGNLGIGLAHICTQLGLYLKICMPESASIERRKIIQGFGAELVLSPAAQGMKGAMNLADEEAVNSPNTFRLNQFTNPDGPKIHYETTGPEILANAKEQGFTVDAFLTGVGSGATFSGVGRYLKEQNSNIFLAAVEPAESAVLSGNAPAPHGIQGIGAGFVPQVLDTTLIQEIFTVKTKEALQIARAILLTEGINVGISTGANVHAACALAQRPEWHGKKIVTMACDTGERYLSTALFD